MTTVTKHTPAINIPRDELFEFQPGNGSRFTVIINVDVQGLTISVIGKGAYTFFTSHHPAYIASKLGIMEGDAVEFNRMIEKIFG